MKKIMWFAAIILCISPTCSFADAVDSFRCNSKLVQIGDSKLHVANSCGDPDGKDSNRGRWGDIDEWTYNRGPRDFIYVLTFKSNQLTAIDAGSRGYFDAKKDPLSPKGECVVEITDWTTVSRSPHTWVKGMLKNKGGVTAARVYVEVKALDKDKRLVNLERFQATPSKIPPGKDASFEVPIKNDPRISSYVPSVTWQPDLD
jgi:hypothetical protein